MYGEQYIVRRILYDVYSTTFIVRRTVYSATLDVRILYDAEYFVRSTVYCTTYNILYVVQNMTMVIIYSNSNKLLDWSISQCCFLVLLLLLLFLRRLAWELLSLVRLALVLGIMALRLRDGRGSAASLLHHGCMIPLLTIKFSSRGAPCPDFLVSSHPIDWIVWVLPITT